MLFLYPGVLLGQRIINLSVLLLQGIKLVCVTVGSSHRHTKRYVCQVDTLGSFHFSFFLMPVYWFALSQVKYINWAEAGLIFVILHLLVYPASNGYNSYMDRDTSPVGGIKNPLQPTAR